MNVVLISVTAFAGAMLSALLGWLDSKEAFDVRKFGASIVRAIIAGIAFAAAYQYLNGIGPLDIAFAFLGGAGVDTLGNRVAGSIRAGLGK